MTLKDFVLDASVKPLTIVLKEASTTSLTIEWEWKFNVLCGKKLLLTITSNKLIDCHAQGPGERNCSKGKPSHMSKIVNSNSTSVKLRSLSANSTYKVKVSLVSFMCKDVVARGVVVLKTLQTGE